MKATRKLITGRLVSCQANCPDITINKIECHFKNTIRITLNTNFLLTEREGHTREYWPEVVAVRPRANIPQYGPEQVKLVSSLLYGIIFRTKQHFR